MKKILFITYDGLTDPLGQSQVLPYIIGLTKKGYEFTILSFEKKERFKKESATIFELINKNGIRWVPLFFTAKPPVLSKIYDRYRMWQKAKHLHKKYHFQLIHCRSYIAAEMGLKLKEKAGVKFLFDMRGFWADEKVDNGQWNLKKRFYKKIYNHYKKKEKSFLLNADGIVSLTHAAKNYLNDQPEYKDVNIDVIPCCADLKHFNYNVVVQDDADKLKNELGFNLNDNILVYLGSIGGWYMTKEMFLFFLELKKYDPSYKMLILTKDDAKIVLEEAIAIGLNKEDIKISYAPRAKLPTYLAICNASIFFIRNTFSKMASSPTKHAELMGMGIPVICNDIGDTGNIIYQTKTGLIINEFSSEDFKQYVLKYCNQQLPDKSVIRNAAKEIFDLEAGVQAYENLYKRILKN